MVVLRVLSIVAAIGVPLAGAVQAMDSSAGKLVVEERVTGLDEPWALGFLPDGAILITERGGSLVYLSGTTAQRVQGLPDIVSEGQGGLLDLLVPRDFAQSQQLYLTYASRKNGQVVTTLGRGRLDVTGSEMRDFKPLFSITSPSDGGRHFGSRLVEARDGTLFMTIGERGDRAEAQNLSSHNGTIIRLNRDGSVPQDNPFVGVAGALPEIWSYGHRNPQGVALDLDGQLWANEHGARGGDEVNHIRPGANYGWPVIAYGRHYSGAKIGEGTAKEGMEQPAHYWDPSIAPSGMMVYSGKLWPEWRGDHFIGSLKFDYIARLDPENGWAEEQLSAPETGRVRDIREAPDGTIWFLSVTNGAAYRVRPEG